jgi:hypothetical protein
MSDESLARIEGQLSTITRLLAVSIAGRHSSTIEKAKTLASAGIAVKLIADICDTSPNSISVALSQLKKKSKAKRVKKKS